METLKTGEVTRHTVIVVAGKRYRKREHGPGLRRWQVFDESVEEWVWLKKTSDAHNFLDEIAAIGMPTKTERFALVKDPEYGLDRAELIPESDVPKPELIVGWYVGAEVAERLEKQTLELHKAGCDTHELYEEVVDAFRHPLVPTVVGTGGCEQCGLDIRHDVHSKEKPKVDGPLTQ